jgi:anaerobic magnesium-protoporphyrin IX monomethyl ester cyclase
MLSILIGHSYFQRFDRKQVERAKPYPPLATLQVAAMLRRSGHTLALFDAMLAEGLQEFEAQLAAVQPQVVVLYEDNYNFLTKMCLGKMRQAACDMIASARRAGARVLAAGSDASDEPAHYLRAGADLVVRGEGLAALSAVLGRLDAEPQAGVARLIEGIAGTVALVDGRPVEFAAATVVAAPRAPAAVDAALEAPAAWDLVDIERYRAVWQRAHGHFSLNMAASKGCPFRCSWCAKPIWGSRYQQRSAAAVAAEMLQLQRSFGAEHIWFADDIFGFRADWVNQLADLLHAEGGGLPFTVQTRADLVTEAVAQALARAGCREAWIGAESGSQQVLDAMNKGTTVDEILRARERLGAQGVRVGFFIQLGYLGEGLDELLATRQLIETARPDDIGVSVAYPLPGTRFHEQVRAQLGSKTHWDDSADLAMMFQGAFDTGFYRRFRDLLHAQVDLGRLGEGALQQARLALQQRWAGLLAGVPTPVMS